MSCRVDTAPLIASSCIVGDSGHGVLGSEVPSTGEFGAGLLFNDVQASGWGANEVRVLVTGHNFTTLFVHENTAVEGTVPGNGVYTVSFDVFLDGILQGQSQALFLVGIVGVMSGALVDSGDDVFAGLMSIGPGGGVSITGTLVDTGDDTITGVLSVEAPTPTPPAPPPRPPGDRVVRSGTKVPVWLDALDVGEIDDIAFDYSHELAAGDTILDATITTEARVGTDPEAMTMQRETYAVIGKRVMQIFDGAYGNVGVTYLIRAQARTSQGKRYLASAFMKVVRRA